MRAVGGGFDIGAGSDATPTVDATTDATFDAPIDVPTHEAAQFEKLDNFWYGTGVSEKYLVDRDCGISGRPYGSGLSSITTSAGRTVQRFPDGTHSSSATVERVAAARSDAARARIRYVSGSSWLEEVWEEREERIYPALFGELRGIFPIPPSRFARFDVAPDPRWLTIGVFECFPTEDRASWVYVTSGLSNPWDDETDPAEPSGYGCELAFESARRGDWAIGLLHHLASIQLLAISGRLDLPVLERGDRLALHGPIDGEASTLRNVLVTAPRWFPETLEQRSGVAEWLFCVGISDTEKAFAREHDNESLLNGLRGAGHASITDPDRASLVF